MKHKNFWLFFVVLFLTILVQGSMTTAQTTEQMISDLALEQFNLREEFAPLRMSVEDSESEVSYSPYKVSSVEQHGDWARVHITSLPSSITDSAKNTFGISFIGGVAHRKDGLWKIAFDDTEEFESLENQFPAWLQFLNTRSSTTLDDVSVPSLPWSLGDTWRLNNGLHYPGLGLDFGTLPQHSDAVLVGEAVYAVDAGEVIYAENTCMIIRRYSDGLQMYYQHLYTVDIDVWESKHGYVTMNEYLARTTNTDGSLGLCIGETKGHHVHFSFLNANDNDKTGSWFGVSQYVGSTLNDWKIDHSGETGYYPIQNTSMVRTYDNGSKQTVLPNTSASSNVNNRLFNSGCIANEVENQSGPLLRLYNDKNCSGGMWFTNQINQVISVGNFSPYSLNIVDGWSVIVYNPQNPPSMQACYSGDLWDMTKDYYPGTSHIIANNIGSVKVVAGGCQCQNALKEDSSVNSVSASCPNTPPPPNVLPLPPGPQAGSGGGVKLYQYPNFGGELLYTFSEGFSNEPNAEGYSLEIPSGWSVITYRGDNRQGENRCWNGSVANLQDHSDWQTKTQSIQIFEGRDVCRTDPPASSLSQNVQFYNSTNYQNPGPGFSTGFHDRKFFQAGSMKIRDGSSVFLYRWDKRQSEAGAFCFNRNVPSLDAAGWPYEIVGLEVFDTDLCQDELISGYDYLLYKDEGFTGGNCGSLGPVAGQDLTSWWCGDWNDRISSIRIRNGWSIRIWDHANYDESGGSRCFSGSVPTMRNHAFNATGLVIAVYPPENGDRDSRISSFAVFDNEHCDGSPEMPGADWSYHLDNGNLAMGQFVMNADENNNQSIRIEWTASPEYVNGYKIYEHIDDDQYELLATVSSGVRSWQHNGLPCGTDFHYLVKAYNQWGESASPNLAYASTPTCYVPPTEGPTPNAPTNLHFTNIDQTSISVAWTDNSSIEEVYEVWFQEVPNGTWYNPTLPANSTSKTISNMPCNTEYNFKVRAVRWESGVTYWSESNGVNTFTASCDSLLKPVVTEVTHIGPWEGAEYAIAYADMNSLNGSYTYEWWLSDYPHGDNERSSPANFYTNGGYEFVTGLESCSQYYFRIRAISNGQFRDSDTFVFSVDCPEGPSPNAPTYLDATNTSTTSISVEWEDNSGIEEIHEVWFQEVPNGNWYSTSFFADSIYGMISGLICNTEYNLFIRAVRWEGGVTYWGESNWISAQTKGCPEGPAPNDPTYLDVANTSETSISVEWEDNSGIEEVYEVWYQRVSDGTWNNSSFPADRIYATTTGLACNTEYNLVVRAVRWESGVPYWGESNWANAHTKGCSGGTEIRVLLPIVVSR